MHRKNPLVRYNDTLIIMEMPSVDRNTLNELSAVVNFGSKGEIDQRMQ